MAKISGEWYQIEGVNETIANLFKIHPTVAKPSVAAGMRKALGIIRKAIRSEIKRGVTGTNLFSVRSTIGTRFVRAKKKSPFQHAKVGGGVGRPQSGPYRSQTHGTGISKRNIHWYLIGNPKRKGGPTMWTKNQRPEPVKRGFATSGAMASRIAVLKMNQVFEAKMRQRIKVRGLRAGFFR